MKFNQVTVLAAAALIIPLGGVVTHLTSNSATAYDTETTLTAQAPSGTRQRLARHHGGGKHGGKRILKHLEEIGVDADRLAQAQKILDACKEDHMKNYEELRAARQKMHDLYASDASDDELRDQYEAMQEMKKASKDARFECKLKIRDLLTVEERQKLIELRKQRWEQRKQRWQERKQRKQEEPQSQGFRGELS